MKHLFSNKNDHDFQNGFKKLERFKIQIGEGNIIMYIAVVHLFVSENEIQRLQI